MNLRNYFIPIIIFLTFFNCQRTELFNNNCIKGKFIGRYCEGFVIQILDNNKIGINWIGMYDSISYNNSVVASIDTTMTKSLVNPEFYFSKDSVFYFQYREGGYAPKQFNVCDPEPFITITDVSKTPCINNGK